MTGEENSSSDTDSQNTAATQETDLDSVDKGVLHALQRDARNVTTQEIAEIVDVSASTVRNRMDKLESVGIIESYHPKINYERAGFPLRVLFVCTIDPDSRGTVAQSVLDARGVTEVTELITSEHNLYIEVIGTSTGDLMRITSELTEYGLQIHSSEIITNNYSQPWAEFECQNE